MLRISQLGLLMLSAITVGCSGTTGTVRPDPAIAEIAFSKESASNNIPIATSGMAQVDYARELFVYFLRSSAIEFAAKRNISNGGLNASGSSAASSEPSNNQSSSASSSAASRFAPNVATSNDDSLKALGFGLTYLYLSCSRYMSKLGLGNQDASNFRQQLNLIGGLSTAVMGLTDASSKAISIVGSTFSFGAASKTAYDQAYLFSDSGTAISGLVSRAQVAYIAGVEYDENRLDYSGVVKILTGYEKICQPAEIRRLINESISAAKPTENGTASASSSTSSSSAGSSPSAEGSSSSFGNASSSSSSKSSVGSSSTPSSSSSSSEATSASSSSSPFKNLSQHLDMAIKTPSMISVK